MAVRQDILDRRLQIRYADGTGTKVKSYNMISIAATSEQLYNAGQGIAEMCKLGLDGIRTADTFELTEEE